MVVDDAMGRTWKLYVQPSWWLAWTPRLRLRPKDSDDVGAAHIANQDLFSMIFVGTLGFLWKRIVWLPVALVIFAIELATVVLLIPIALAWSAIGLRRHHVVAVAQDDGTRREVVQRGLLATLRARRELASSLAAPSAAP